MTAYSLSKIEEFLHVAALSCEHIIQAARDVGMVKRDVFPATLFVAGEKVTEITEYDILRRKLDYDHFKISKEWLNQSGLTKTERKKIREKLNHGLQSIVWFTNMGCPYLTFVRCCETIDDALRLINTEYSQTSGILLDPELLAERILDEPEEMTKLFEQVQSKFINATIKNEADTIVDDWFQTDYVHSLGWDDCKAVVPAENEYSCTTIEVLDNFVE